MKSFFISLLSVLLASSTLANDPVLDSAFEKYLMDNIKTHGTVGVAVGVVKNGKLVYAKGFGYRDLDKKLPVTSKTLFGIGSTTKAFTATSIGLLVEQKLISYDVPVISILPDFDLSNPITAQTANLRDLLGHTTGVPRHDMAWFSNFRTRDDVFKNLFSFPHHNGLREVWEYNNIMYLVAGVVVDRVSGSAWEDFVKRNILDPLEMKTTNFSTDDSKKNDDFSYAYYKNTDGKLFSQLHNVDLAGPAGSINSNLEDISHWLAAQIDLGKWNGNQMISENVIAETHKPYFEVNDGSKKSTETYGQGWLISNFEGKKIIYHNGAVAGFFTSVGFIPEIKTGVIVFLNTPKTLNSDRIMESVFERILGLPQSDRLNTPPPKLNLPDKKNRKFELLPLPATEYLGTYDNFAYGEVVVDVAAENNKGLQLILRYKGTELPLRHDRENVFALSEFEDVVFELGVEGKPRSLFIPFEPAIRDFAPIEFRRK